MAWLDSLLSGIKNVQAAGAAVAFQQTLNFGGGLTVTPDPTNGRNTITANPGGLSVTGTGFAHVTSGAFDAAARAVNLASSDITGNLAISHVAPGADGTVLSTNGSGATAWVAPGATPAAIGSITTAGTYHVQPGDEYYIDLGGTVHGNVLLLTDDIDSGQGFYWEIVDPSGVGTGGHNVTIYPIGGSGSDAIDAVYPASGPSSPGTLTNLCVANAVGEGCFFRSPDGTNLWSR
jgi:hypothetical protein